MEVKERTLYCGNLSEKVTEDLLYELFLQAGPLENVTIPKDKDGRQRNYSFITFKHAVSVPYSLALMGGVALFGKVLKLDARSGAESAPNPYLEQLMQYHNNMAQQSFQNENRMYDSRSRRRDSRRYDQRPEMDSGRFDLMNAAQSPVTIPILYPVLNQRFAQPSYQLQYGMQPNQWQGYR